MATHRRGSQTDCVETHDDKPTRSLSVSSPRENEYTFNIFPTMMLSADDGLCEYSGSIRLSIFLAIVVMLVVTVNTKDGCGKCHYISFARRCIVPLHPLAAVSVPFPSCHWPQLPTSRLIPTHSIRPSIHPPTMLSLFDRWSAVVPFHRCGHPSTLPSTEPSHQQPAPRASRPKLPHRDCPCAPIPRLTPIKIPFITTLPMRSATWRKHCQRRRRYPKNRTIEK